eukprot:2851292-Rhodomonas_salina.1
MGGYHHTLGQYRTLCRTIPIGRSHHTPGQLQHPAKSKAIARKLSTVCTRKVFDLAPTCETLELFRESAGRLCRTID